jgi:hypothetical protein
MPRFMRPMNSTDQQPATATRLTRPQLLSRWGLKAPITLRRYEKAGKLHALRFSSRHILYDLEEIQRFEDKHNTAFEQEA